MPIFAGQTRDELRRAYVEAWRKHGAGLPLTPLEAQIAAVIADHPQYTRLLEPDAQALTAEFTPASGRENPFLHMGLHLAVRDQVATNRPPGIAAVHAELVRRFGDAHRAEHAMIERLAEALWESQRAQRAPDEQRYLERLRAL